MFFASSSLKTSVEVLLDH